MTARRYLRPPRVRHDVGDEAEAAGLAQQQHHLLLRVALERDLGLPRRLPDPQYLRTLSPGLFVRRQRSVTTLGGGLSLPHLEVLPHHQHQLGVLVILDVAVVALVTRRTN